MNPFSSVDQEFDDSFCKDYETSTMFDSPILQSPNRVVSRSKYIPHNNHQLSDIKGSTAIRLDIDVINMIRSWSFLCRQSPIPLPQTYSHALEVFSWSLPEELVSLSSMFANGLMITTFRDVSTGNKMVQVQLKSQSLKPVPLDDEDENGEYGHRQGDDRRKKLTILVGRLYDEALEVPAMLLEQGRVGMVEQWFSEDKVVYRLLYVPQNSVPSKGISTIEIRGCQLLAAEVIAVCRETVHLNNQIFVNNQLLRYANGGEVGQPANF
jgi:hypothetical protein